MAKQIKAFHLHDSETEEILGTVFIDSDNPTSENEDELFEGWKDYNKLQEHEENPEVIDEFIIWFNENYITQIGYVDMQFIQPS